MTKSLMKFLPRWMRTPFFPLALPLTVLLVLSGCDNEKRYSQPYCGNGAIDDGEECDGASLGGATCVSRGFSGGILTCSLDCMFDTDECTGGCQDACTQGITRCDSETAAQSCIVGPRGCTEWLTTPCEGDTPYCVVDQGTARCAASPCLVDCTPGEKRCSSDGHARQVCVLDENDCPQWDSSPCPEETPVCHLTDGVFSCEAM